jgi:hypothetical protein
LHRELHWIVKRLEQRKSHLSPDERRDVDAFYERVCELVARLPTRADAQQASDRQELVTLNEVPELYQLLEAIESARFVAEANILDETNEDEGI